MDPVEGAGAVGGHQAEPHGSEIRGRLNWLRAGVLGANDGIISTAGLVIGVAAATSDTTAIAAAGFAGVIAGAVSMALGEYVSVSTQLDTELALVQKERGELAAMPATELRELRSLLRRRGLSPETAALAADELTQHDALGAHLDFELGIDPPASRTRGLPRRRQRSRSWRGRCSRSLAILVPSSSARIPVAVVAVLIALVVTGAVSVWLGGGNRRQAITRLLLGGSLAMAVTYGVGELVGTAI